MNNAEKLQLLQEANKAYREGNPIMGDSEYDTLEAELGLENINEIGEKHSPEMTIRHPFIMGSLSKIQVHADKEGHVDWGSLLKELRRYIGSKEVIITPKYDGCSFEAYFKDGECVSVSTRGDGYWGRDISKHIYNKIPEAFRNLNSEYTLRGEILVNRSLFEKKYAASFANTRSFVAGVTGQDYDANDNDLLAKLNDLEIVIYDYRVNENGIWIDKNWTELIPIDKTHVLPQVYLQQQIGLAIELASIYNRFSNYRDNCQYSLDGFVIKPVNRVQDFTNARPKDCVAIKFLPMTAVTTIENITWELGKTGEYYPVVYYKVVKMDGKTCVKASGHNYGTLVEKGIAPGAEVVISMAGDIIPYIYKVTKPVELFDDFENKVNIAKLNIPENCYIDGVHLYKNMTDEEWRVEEFRNSCKTLNVPGLGDELIQKMIDGIRDEEEDVFFDEAPREFPFSVFELEPVAFQRYIGGKTGDKIAKAYQKVLTEIDLPTIIETMNIRFCGKTLSKEIAKYLTGQPHDFGNMAQAGWAWSIDYSSDEFMKLKAILKMIGKDLNYFSTIAEQTAKANETAGSKTYVILTGEPNDYATKAEFLNAHPEYELTGSWTKVQIVFTNSLDSNTGKMKKAREKGVEIRLY